MRECTYVEATREAIADALAADPRVFVLGHDIGDYGGRFQTTVGLRERFGERRVRELVGSERSLSGLLGGAAMVGTRPIVDLTPLDHLLYSLGPFGHQLALLPALTEGRIRLPLVIRAAIGAGFSAGPLQSGNLHALFARLPGLKVVAPSSPGDAKGLLAAAIACDDPVLLLEHKQLLGQRGAVSEESCFIDLDRAAVVRSGGDLTIASYGAMLAQVRAASELLHAEEIETEIIDLRSLAPLDLETVIASVARTGRLLLVDDAYRSCSILSELAAELAAHAIDYLDAPIARLSSPVAPVPYSPALEGQLAPREQDICAVARQLFEI